MAESFLQLVRFGGKMMFISVITLCCIAGSFGAKLPSFIQPCSRSDPNFSNCVLDHGNAAWPAITKGSKEYKLMTMAPMKLAALDLDAGNIKIHFENLVIYNMENMKLTKVDFNLKERRLFVQLVLDETWLEGDYKIDGKILILPISGEGHANFKHFNNTLAYDAKFVYEQRNGKEYIKVVDPKVEAGTKKGMYNFDNLFNGNKELTAEMNNFLTENWMDFWLEMKPTFEKMLVAIAQDVIDNFFGMIPVDELFLP